MRILTAAAVLILIGALAMFTLTRATQPADPVAEHRARLAMQTAQLDAERAQERAAALEPLNRTAAAAWLLFVAAVPLVALGVALDAYTQRRRPLIAPDARGLLPISRPSVADVRIRQAELERAFTASLAAYHRTQLAAAERPAIDRLNLTITAPARSHGTNEAPALPDAPAPVVVPTFRAMLDSGLIQRGSPMVLGFADGEPLRGSWNDLYSSAVAGVQGSGKSVTMRYLACQAALHGGRLVVVDPHMETSPEDSLARSLMPLHHAMLCAPVAEPAGILETARLMTAQLDSRLRGDKNRTPVIFIVDEFTQTMRTPAVAAELALLLERLATEGRKVQLFACLGGQTWGMERSGGTPLRNALASAYVHRIRRAEALKLLQLGQDTPQTHDLPTGGAWLYRTSGELVRVQMPLTTPGDVAHVAELLSPRRLPTTIDIPPALPVAACDVADEAAPEAVDVAPRQEHQKALDARAARVRELVRAETPTRDILREVWGITTSGGAQYARAAAELRSIMAKLV